MPMPHRRPLVLLRSALPLLLIGACKGGGSGPNDYTPLVCGQGNGASAAAAVDAQGGTVSVRGHSLTVPAGGVSARTEFSITEVQTGYIRVEVGPHGTKFGSNATLTLSYARCGGTPAGDLRIVEVRSDQNNEVDIIRTLPSRVDAAAGTVTTTGLDHLSGYLIAGT